MYSTYCRFIRISSKTTELVSYNILSYFAHLLKSFKLNKDISWRLAIIKDVGTSSSTFYQLSWGNSLSQFRINSLIVNHLQSISGVKAYALKKNLPKVQLKLTTRLCVPSFSGLIGTLIITLEKISCFCWIGIFLHTCAALT